MFDEKALEFMKKIFESFGPSGFEQEPAKLVKEYAEPYADEIKTDKLGSIICALRGESERPYVLLAGHLDEIGFVVSGIEKETGFLTFNPIGSWWDQVLLSQRVVIRTSKGDIHGTIAAKPPHTLTREEREKVVKMNQMYIDIGATSREEAEKIGIKIGDPIVPWSPFSIIRNGEIVMGKSFDGRIGAFVIAETLRQLKENDISHPNTLYLAATVQEEVGLRGAKTVAHLVDPDIGLVFDTDIAGDVPGIKSHEAPTKMGRGPSLLTYDRSMIPNQPLKNFVIEVAERVNIPLQLSQAVGGGTDAGRIHLDRAGCPSIVIGIPTRHIHTHVGLLSLKDVENSIKLAIELIKRLDEKRVGSFVPL